MTRWIRTAAFVAAAGVSPLVARGQAPDSTPRFSLFGGTALGTAPPGERALKVEGGIAADFRMRAFPLDLRASLAFGQDDPNSFTSERRYGTLALDTVARPVRGIFGVRPYLVGGLGLATSAEYRSSNLYYYQLTDPNVSALQAASVVQHGRGNWAFAEGGAGLEFGKLFLQAKVQKPVASNGVTRMPITLGFHF